MHPIIQKTLGGLSVQSLSQNHCRSFPVSGLKRAFLGEECSWNLV